MFLNLQEKEISLHVENICYNGAMLKLNTAKIKAEMARIGIDEVFLAQKWGHTRQAVYDILKRRPITQAEKFARELNLDAKDLIINE